MLSVVKDADGQASAAVASSFKFTLQVACRPLLASHQRQHRTSVRFVRLAAPPAGRSCELFPDRFDLHLLRSPARERERRFWRQTLDQNLSPRERRPATYTRVSGLMRLGRRKRESSLLMTHWSESTSSSEWFCQSGLAPWELEFPFPGSLISTFPGKGMFLWIRVLTAGHGKVADALDCAALAQNPKPQPPTP